MKQNLLHNFSVPAPFKIQLLKWLGLSMLLVWIAMAILYAYPRWLYADSAYTFFRVLNNESLIYDRFSNLLHLAPSILMAKMNVPAIVIFHTLNLSLPLLFILGWFWQINTDSSKALIFPFLLWICGPQAFFMGYSEILMAAFFFGILICFKPNHKIKVLSGFWAICLLMFMSHPAAWLLSVPIFIYHTSISGKKMMLPISFSILAAALIQQLLSPPANPYDSSLLDNILDTRLWLNIKMTNSASYLSEALRGWMWFLFPTISLLIYSMIENGKWKYLSVMLIFWIFAFSLVMVIYHQGDAHSNMEKFFYPCLATVTGTFIFYDQNKYRITLLGLILVISQLLFIAKQSHKFCHRYQLLSASCNHYLKLGKTKVLGSFSDECWQSVWAMPYESMSFTAVKNKTTITIRSSEKSKLINDSIAASDSLFLGAEFMPPWPQRLLNKQYFALPKRTYFINTAINPPHLTR